MQEDNESPKIIQKSEKSPYGKKAEDEKIWKRLHDAQITENVFNRIVFLRMTIWTEIYVVLHIISAMVYLVQSTSLP